MAEKVQLETNLGTIVLELFPDKAPETVKNFLGYVNDGFYNGVIFHRVIPGFMIQGGGFEPGMKQKKTKDPIKNEADNMLSNKRGTVAMARTSIVNSATAQFFINLKDNHFLDHTSNNPEQFGYAVFGEVREGMDVVDAIAQVKTGSRGFHQDVPIEDVVITQARIID